MERNGWTWRMLDLAMRERDEIAAWRLEDLMARRYHLLAIADQALDRLHRLIGWLSDRQFDQLTGARHG